MAYSGGETEAPIGNEDEIAFGYRIAYTWARWAHEEYSYALGVQQARIWGYKPPVKGKHGELALSEDDMMIIDRSVTRWTWREKKMVFVDFFQDETQEQKAKRFNCESRRTYRRRVDQIMLELYDSLHPKSEDWRLAVL